MRSGCRICVKIYRAMRIYERFSVSDLERVSGGSYKFAHKIVTGLKEWIDPVGVRKSLAGGKEKVWRLKKTGEEYLRKLESQKTK